MSFQSDASGPADGSADLDRHPARSNGVDRRKEDTRRRCSYCEKVFDATSSPCLPFCSTRCQQIDLHKWMSESYSLPLEGQEDVEHDHVDE